MTRVGAEVGGAEREIRATLGTLATEKGTWVLRAWVCPDLDRGCLVFPANLLTVILLCSEAEHPTPDPMILLLLVWVWQ